MVDEPHAADERPRSDATVPFNAGAAGSGADSRAGRPLDSNTLPGPGQPHRAAAQQGVQRAAAWGLIGVVVLAFAFAVSRIPGWFRNTPPDSTASPSVTVQPPARNGLPVSVSSSVPLPRWRAVLELQDAMGWRVTRTFTRAGAAPDSLPLGSLPYGSYRLSLDAGDKYGNYTRAVAEWSVPTDGDLEGP